MDCKVTDVVHVRGTVSALDKTPGYPLFHIEFDGGGPGYWASADEIMHVEPRPLAVGDKVTWGTRQADYRILCINEGWAWLRRSDGVRDGFAQMMLGDLVLCPTEAP